MADELEEEIVPPSTEWTDRYRSYGGPASKGGRFEQTLIFIDSNEVTPELVDKARLVADFAARCSYKDMKELWFESYTAEQFNGALKPDVAAARAQAAAARYGMAERRTQELMKRIGEGRIYQPESNEADIDFRDDIRRILQSVDLGVLKPEQKENVQYVASILKRTRHNQVVDPPSIDLAAWQGDEEIFHALYANSKVRSLIKRAYEKEQEGTGKPFTFNRADLALLSELENQFSAVLNKPDPSSPKRWIVVTKDKMIKRNAEVAAQEGGKEKEVSIVDGITFADYLHTQAMVIAGRFEHLRQLQGKDKVEDLFSAADKADWREFIAAFEISEADLPVLSAKATHAAAAETFRLKQEGSESKSL